MGLEPRISLSRASMVVIRTLPKHSKQNATSGGWHTRDIRGSYGTSLWKEISKEWLSFYQNAVFVLGDGRRINFWRDAWSGAETLCNRFPNLFNIATNREAKVAEIWDSREGEECWSPTFIRPLNDWELEEMSSFLLILFFF